MTAACGNCGRRTDDVDGSCRLCRLLEAARKAASLDVPKPPPVSDGQDSLFVI